MIQRVVCLDGGIKEAAVGYFILNGNIIRPIQVKQLSNPYLNVKLTISVVKAFKRLKRFLDVLKHVDVLLFEHNAFVAPTIIQLLGAVIGYVWILNPRIVIKKLQANQIKKACLGHAGMKYKKYQRRYYMKAEMTNFVNKTFGTNLTYAEHDSADVYGMIYTYWKMENNKKK